MFELLEDPNSEGSCTEGRGDIVMQVYVRF